MMTSPLAIVNDGPEGQAGDASLGAVVDLRPAATREQPVPAERVDTPQSPYIKNDGQLVIDHKLEGIVNAIRDVDLPKESPTMAFKGGLHLSGEFNAGSIEVDGTLIISEGAVVNVQKLKAKRLYVNRGSLTCVSAAVGSLIAWDGEITALHEIAYGALEESRYCAINGTMRWVRA